ncbi:MAG: response regulator transcription factor [Acidimicrobiia bacterium]|nr:response regulator transcription factor [Acidimicrobiia bacterium]
MTHVLVVDDDPKLRSALTRALRLEGYAVDAASNGQVAYQVIQDEPPDAVVLDVMMPEMDGLTLCRQIRRDGLDLPVLVLTARHLVSDKVSGLDAGADDYVVKPFALEELLARLRALLRRTSVPSGSPVLQVADLVLDPTTREVTRGDRELFLTRTEFALLELLMQHPGQVLTREVIFERVWGCDLSGSSNSLDVYIGYLRRKTEEGGSARLIRTVRGVGYVLKDP